VTIKDIQQSARAASETMQGALKDADAGTSLGVQAEIAVNEIRQATAAVHSVFQDIAAGIAEQSSAGQSLASNVEVVAQAADASSAVVTRAASAAQTLESLAGSIRSRVSQFRV
ncbi:MAG TPA: methyl-accepting chemotaxis protein, partial [Zoogloea sp.]|nr:methyl-accepting chemotaxis protein [Zoogloea sp.]